jgi:hypothetical protein
MVMFGDLLLLLWDELTGADWAGLENDAFLLVYDRDTFLFGVLRTFLLWIR